jgi:glycosyltransferase involved in cell wall biosynthesis
LLDVARELAQQELAFELLFVGNITPNSPYGNAFQERIKPLEEQGCARWIGTKTCHELVELLDAASGMVHFSPAESFGLAVAEGLARDLKLFAARVGGVADIAQGVPGAELFDVDDWRGLTAAIAGWVRRGFPRAHGAGEVMRVRYRPETIARQHLEVYREVLGHPR